MLCICKYTSIAMLFRCVSIFISLYGRVKLVNIIIIGDFFCQGSNGWDVVNCFIIMTLFLAVYL